MASIPSRSVSFANFLSTVSIKKNQPGSFHSQNEQDRGILILKPKTSRTELPFVLFFVVGGDTWGVLYVLLRPGTFGAFG